MENCYTILKKFDETNKQIRIKDNISSDNYYDKMINECIIDTVIELINKERIHFKQGEPFLCERQEKEIKLINTAGIILPVNCSVKKIVRKQKNNFHPGLALRI